MKGFIRRQQLVNWVKRNKKTFIGIGIGVGTTLLGEAIYILITKEPPKELVHIYTDDLADWISTKLDMDYNKVLAILDAEAIYQIQKGIIHDPDGSFTKELEEEIGEMISSGRVS